MLVALPLLAASRAAWEFFGERVELAEWDAEQPGVELAPELKTAPDPPEQPPAAAAR